MPQRTLAASLGSEKGPPGWAASYAGTPPPSTGKISTTRRAAQARRRPPQPSGARRRMPRRAAAAELANVVLVTPLGRVEGDFRPPAIHRRLHPHACEPSHRSVVVRLWTSYP